MAAGPLSFSSPAQGVAGLVLFAAAVLTVLLRRPVLPSATKGLAAAGMLLLCLAAGGATWRRPAAREVAVLVDLSPSTRSADYRTRAKLETRIRQLLGDTPYRLLYFADDVRASVPPGPRLPDLPAERTVFAPPAAAAVVLFSDGRFDPPTGGAPVGGPPTYPVLDQGLLAPADAAVEGLEPRGTEVAVRLRNDGPPRSLTFSGTRASPPTTLPTGAFVLSRPIDAQAAALAATLSPGDLWPENDALSAPMPPPAEAERWIVGAAAPGADWRSLSPEDLPTDAAAYLAPAVIVLSDVAASGLSPPQQDRLRQYVRDLGGGLVILGGPHAFAAGGYPGTTLDALSPLASTPPQPTTHWMLLADSSGSMNSPAVAGGGDAGTSRWRYAADAIVRALPRLPPDDVVSVGSFAETVTWWSAGRSVRETQGLPLPPPDVRPHGPTNLRPALEAVATQADSALPKQLLLLSDADADVGDPASLAAVLAAKNIHLHLLALGDGRGLAALRRVVADTGGQFVQQADAARWAAAVQDLTRAAAQDLLENTPLGVRFTGELASLPARSVAPWNRTWLKRDATALGEASAGAETLASVARWNVGEGSVLAADFAASAAELERFAAAVARPPRDPRFRVTWDAGRQLRVVIDATSGGTYLNGQSLTLELAADGAPGEPRRIPQTGPGRYELSVPAPRTPAFAAVRSAGRVIDRVAVAGRYAPEFDAIGADREALRLLASRTGGAVIDPQTTGPIDFHWPPRDVPLVPWLAAAGALCVAAGLVWWRK